MPELHVLRKEGHEEERTQDPRNSRAGRRNPADPGAGDERSQRGNDQACRHHPGREEQFRLRSRIPVDADPQTPIENRHDEHPRHKSTEVDVGTLYYAVRRLAATA